MKTQLEPEDIQAIVNGVIEKLKPIIAVHGKHDKYMTTKELAGYMGLAYSTIANNKKHLPHTYLNGTPLFKQSDIDAFLDQFRVKPKEKKKNQKFTELFTGRLST